MKKKTVKRKSVGSRRGPSRRDAQTEEFHTKMTTDANEGTNNTDPNPTIEMSIRRDEEARRSVARAPLPDGTFDVASNRLLQLPEDQRYRYLGIIRNHAYDGPVKRMLHEDGIEKVSSEEISEFFEIESETNWQKRLARAASEANGLIRQAEKSPAKYSLGILTALGQETFRQVASGEMAPEAIGKLATLFLKARGDDRVDQMQELKREQVRQGMQGQVNQALEELAQEVERNPHAREAFENLRRELSRKEEE